MQPSSRKPMRIHCLCWAGEVEVMGVGEEENPLLFSGLEAHTQRHQQVHLSSGVSSSTIKEIWLESKKLWQIAGPSIFSRLAMFSMTVITQSFAGHLGDLNLASISIATTLIISISFGFLVIHQSCSCHIYISCNISLINFTTKWMWKLSNSFNWVGFFSLMQLGMASALETLCGRAYGAKQYHMLGIYMQRSWIVLFLCSILLLPLFLFATPILKLIGQPADIAEQTGLVAIWLIPFHFSFPFQFTLQRFLQSQLKTGVIALVSGGALLIHVILSWVFVYKLRVGIVGTALTLDFSWWVSVFGMFIYCVCGGCQLSWTGFSTQAFTGLWEFFKLSLASGIMLLYVYSYLSWLLIDWILNELVV